MRYAPSIPEEGAECYWITEGPYDAGVACVYGPQTGDTEQTARLFVASKDLFESLCRLERWATSQAEPCEYSGDHPLALARAAIAKATGAA